LEGADEEAAGGAAPGVADEVAPGASAPAAADVEAADEEAALVEAADVEAPEVEAATAPGAAEVEAADEGAVEEVADVEAPDVSGAADEKAVEEVADVEAAGATAPGAADVEAADEGAVEEVADVDAPDVEGAASASHTISAQLIRSRPTMRVLPLFSLAAPSNRSAAGATATGEDFRSAISDSRISRTPSRHAKEVLRLALSVKSKIVVGRTAPDCVGLWTIFSIALLEVRLLRIRAATSRISRCTRSGITVGTPSGSFAFADSRRCFSSCNTSACLSMLASCNGQGYTLRPHLSHQMHHNSARRIEAYYLRNAIIHAKLLENTVITGVWMRLKLGPRRFRIQEHPLKARKRSG
jgi:hypothetical protein